MNDLTLIVPTLYERECLAELIERVQQVRQHALHDLEMLIIDDCSKDGSLEFVNGLGHPWIRFIERRNQRDLSLAVIEGIRMAQSQWIAVMDADLSHPPEVLPKMLEILASGADLVIGSRYVAGGSTDAKWSIFRFVESRVATRLARRLVHLHDPMAGFFAMPKPHAKQLNCLQPCGYKILVEIVVKLKPAVVVEIPIHFMERTKGHSKLGWKQRVLFMMHLWKLWRHSK